MALETVNWTAQSNVGRQRVVDLVQQQKTLVELTHYGRAARTAEERRQSIGQHVMEIWRRGRRQHLVGQHRGVVSDAVLHRQPVQQRQQGRLVCATTQVCLIMTVSRSIFQ